MFTKYYLQILKKHFKHLICNLNKLLIRDMIEIKEGEILR